MPLQLEPLAPLDDVAALDQAVPGLSGTPMMIAIELIDEDPEQPRTEFDDESLAELAATIAERGVKQPISVRPHPDQAGRWMLNFGARRLRASNLAGKTEIPAFVDAAADSYDQVIENEQREALTPLELALFVQRRMAAGDRQAEIARQLGKTRGYLTFVGALIEAPDWLLSLYRSGRCRGITELYDLRKLHQTQPDVVEQWLVTQPQVTRADVQALKDRLKPVTPSPAKQAPSNDKLDGSLSAVEPNVPSTSSHRQAAMPPNSVACTVQHEQGCASRRGVTVLGEIDGLTVRVLVDVAPAEDGNVFVNTSAKSSRRAVAIESIRALRLVRG